MTTQENLVALLHRTLDHVTELQRHVLPTDCAACRGSGSRSPSGEEGPCEVLIFKITPCARCDGTHEKLTAVPFDKPMMDGETIQYTHWATCPESNQPILINVVFKDE